MPMPPGLRRALHKKLNRDFMDYYRDLDPEQQELIARHLSRGRSGIEEGEFDDWGSVESFYRDPLTGETVFGERMTRLSFTSPREVIARLEEIIEQGPRAPEDLTVYRGGPDPVSTRMHRWRYPVSTSLDPDVAHWFADDYFEEGRVNEILVPEGSPMLYPADLYKLMDQYEVMLPQGRVTMTERRAPTRARLDRELEELNLRDKDAVAEYEELRRLMDQYEYEPPYAEGGLVHGHA